MGRIRCLVNAELIAEDTTGNETQVQIGASTYFEATAVHVYDGDEETLADIELANGTYIRGVSWNQRLFENHGVPETRVPKVEAYKFKEEPVVEPTVWKKGKKKEDVKSTRTEPESE